jgi:hypothetical protein
MIKCKCTAQTVYLEVNSGGDGQALDEPRFGLGDATYVVRER